MPRTVALIPVDLEHGAFGLRSRVADTLAGRPVLHHAAARVLRVPAVEAVVVVHPANQDPRPLLVGVRSEKSILFHAFDPADDPYRRARTSARAWAPHAWRGGLGGATVYDELLPAAPLLAAMEAHNATAALLAGGDWPLVDPEWSARVIDLHLSNPDAMQLTFTQAPPGLAGVAIGRPLLARLAERPSATIGGLLGYQPSMPQPDPIGRDVCVQITPDVRSCAMRFIDDTPRAAALIAAIAADLGDALATAAASAVCRAASTAACGFASARLPQQITLELTPARPATGPITVHHYTSFDRDPIPLDLALTIVKQLGDAGDIALTLGGPAGCDALLHPDWVRIAAAAHDAGVLSIAVETDLLADRDTVAKLLDAPIGVVTVRLNADRAATYAQVMGRDDFATVVGNLEWLLNERNRRAAAGGSETPGIPWIIPRLIKTAETLPDMETFFDRWTHYAGHAVIEPARGGCGTMPAQSLVTMAPPRRKPCRQIESRMTILSNGMVAQCDQDWHGRAAAGSAASAPLLAIWKSMQTVRDTHRTGRGHELALCGACEEWHRP